MDGSCFAIQLFIYGIGLGLITKYEMILNRVRNMVNYRIAQFGLQIRNWLYNAH